MISERNTAGSKPKIVLQTLLTKNNEEKLEELKTFGKQLGVDELIVKDLFCPDSQEISFRLLIVGERNINSIRQISNRLHPLSSICLLILKCYKLF